MEASLDDGLGLDGRSMGVELDTKALLRMDTATRYKAASDAIGGGWMSQNEARISEDLEPVEGGDSPYLQQQNYSLAALAKRDADDPFPAPVAAPAVVAAEDEAEESDTEEDIEERAMLAALMLEKELRDAQYA
jgi:phage portal protein BeeE